MPDPAALAADLVAAGLRVAELTPERQTLEAVVLAATSGGSDDFSVTDDRGRRERP